ncbi:MAG: hypothetical protein LBK62_03560 [Treponema sp.]|nr:hypothetical protein [Treponema sp.]
MNGARPPRPSVPGRFFAILCLCFIFVPLFSCAARINGALQETGRATLLISASLQPRMTALIRSLSAAVDSAPANRPVLDGEAIARSMSAAPGIDSVSFGNTGPAAIEGPVRISRIGDFLASGGAGGGFIGFEQHADGGRCTINLSRDSGPQILSLISPEIADYLSALMAPLATGEVLGKAEYLFLVSTVYGKGVADEISQSSIHASIEFPGPVQSVRGGTFSGRRADFNIPLPDILVLEKPLSYEVIWK